MPFTPLYAVTSTLITLLKKNLAPFLGGVEPEVLPQSPDKVPTDGTIYLSVYLYHAHEEPHFKNLDVPGGTIANAPLSLCLYYVVTAHKVVDDLPSVMDEQNYLGYALKTFHDYPVITKNTKVQDDLVLDSALQDHTLQIIYRPVTPEDAVTFWNGDDARLIRFSAFYEVRVVFLEPEPVKSLPGYVLTVGNYVLPTGVMAISSSESVVRFTPPGGAPIKLVASPARVALSELAPPGEVPNNQLTLRGTRLGGGQLVLRSPLFDPPNNQIIVVPALNPLWEVSVTANRLTARIHKELKRPDGTLQTLLPGIYGASIQLSSHYQLPGGLTKTIVSRSNEIAIAVTPFITTSTSGGPNIIVLEIDDQNELADVAPDEISVVVNGQLYDPGPEPVALKTFHVDADNHQISVGTPFTDPGVYPVRLIIRGTESPPFWIVIPE